MLSSFFDRLARYSSELKPWAWRFCGLGDAPASEPYYLAKERCWLASMASRPDSSWTEEAFAV